MPLGGNNQAITAVFTARHLWGWLRMATPAVTMYTTQWCGYCVRLKSQLDRSGIAYREVDIELDPAAADFVMDVNGGNQTVPTVVFEDGSTATNPTAAAVAGRVAQITGASARTAS